MKTKKVPMRMCIVTKTMYPKKDLIRVVRLSDNSFVIDFTGKANGRGAYVADSEEAFSKLVKTKALSRAFKQDVSQQVHEQILEDYLARKQN